MIEWIHHAVCIKKYCTKCFYHDYCLSGDDANDGIFAINQMLKYGDANTYDDIESIYIGTTGCFTKNNT